MDSGHYGFRPDPFKDCWSFFLPEDLGDPNITIQLLFHVQSGNYLKLGGLPKLVTFYLAYLDTWHVLSLDATLSRWPNCRFVFGWSFEASAQLVHSLVLRSRQRSRTKTRKRWSFGGLWTKLPGSSSVQVAWIYCSVTLNDVKPIYIHSVGIFVGVLSICVLLLMVDYHICHIITIELRAQCKLIALHWSVLGSRIRAGGWLHPRMTSPERIRAWCSRPFSYMFRFVLTT